MATSTKRTACISRGFRHPLGPPAAARHRRRAGLTVSHEGDRRAGLRGPSRGLALTPEAERLVGLAEAAALREHLAACHAAGRILDAGGAPCSC